ncbi:MAG: ribonuclease Y [Candidatus Firestonebacteria bacterium]
MSILYGVTILVIGILGSIGGYLVRKHLAESKIMSAEKMAKKIIEEAEKQVENKKREAILEAKDKLYKIKADFEEEANIKKQDLQNLEKRLTQKEENSERKLEILDKKDKDIQNRERAILTREKSVKEKEEQLGIALEEERQRLEKISGLTAEMAKKLLLQSMESEMRHEAAILMKRIEDEAKDTAEKNAKKILTLAIQRCAMEHTVETTVSVIPIPNEEMKGRIIGREGRNIRALEAATGVDVIIDDTPEAVVVSGFDVVRREIARISLERLLSDGRIHPARIEEVVAKVKNEMDGIIKETGEQAVLKIGIPGIHPEIVKLLGRLKYRTSYGQNVLQHSIEVARLAGLLAAELNLDVPVFKRAGFLHDIGKAIDHEVEGTHDKLGEELARKYGESQRVIFGIAGHHSDDIQRPLEAIIVQAADAISSSRPGARGETLENYVKRLKKLESIAESFKGVQKSYAIQAGREVRIMVEHEQISDADALQLARDIAKKIETEHEYPGQIKVTVIREMRVVEYAK